jgi:hypothetical protein
MEDVALYYDARRELSCALTPLRRRPGHNSPAPTYVLDHPFNFLSLDTVTGLVMFPAIFYATLTQMTVLCTLVVDGVAKIIYQNQQFRWIGF